METRQFLKKWIAPIRWYFGQFKKGMFCKVKWKHVFRIYSSWRTQSYMTQCGLNVQRRTVDFFLTTRVKATEKCLYIKSCRQKWVRWASRSCGKYYVLSHSSIMKKGNLSKSGDSVMTAGAVAAMEMNLPRFKNIHRRASWNELTQGQKTFFCVA